MFKGLIALFTSGVIFSPLVLLGVISGFFAIIKMTPEAIADLFGDFHFYGAVAFVAAGYTLIFAKIYKEGGIDVDWPATIGRIVWNFVRYFIAFVLSMSFVTMFSIF